MELLDRLLHLLTYHAEEPLLFTSGMFLFFMLFLSLGYFLLRRQRAARLAYVTLLSYYFFYKNAGLYCGLLALVTVTDFYLSRAIGRSRLSSPTRARWWLVLSLVVDVGLLVYFKYTNFFAGLIAQAVHGNFQPLDIFLPVGISFFTFRSISYVVDVYRGRMSALRSLPEYAFYVSFFPVLLAGPITRTADFVAQMRRPLAITSGMFYRGVVLIACGLLKKAVVADYISQNFVGRVFDMPSLFSGGEILLALYGYSVQLYLDFSGYSDMAIGLALLLGFHIPDNFRAPYKADSLTDFWRRWHISLSSWIRDYIYIPLGGNRRGALRMHLNQVLAMTLCGLWHGASLGFLLWGFLHGVGVCLHKFFSSGVMGHGRGYHPRGWRRGVAVVLTFHAVTLLWVFFRCADVSTAWQMLVQVPTAFHAELLPQALSAYAPVMVLMALSMVLHLLPSAWNERAVQWAQRGGIVCAALLLTLVIVLVIQVRSTDVLPFIYLQF